MHAYKLFPKRVASLLECLAGRCELEGGMGTGGAQLLPAKPGTPIPDPEPPELCVLLWPPLLAFLGWVSCS